MDDDRAKWSIESTWNFGDNQYTVSADVQDDLLFIQVEERFTANKWRGRFNPKHIEELTRKTGNFKKFTVFLNMLESAIIKSSDSVILDLLTYEDLELMWEKKIGSNNRGKKEVSKPEAKRYLILTYNVEFDRIHYPLALTYCGSPDPIILQDIIRKLIYEKKALGTNRHSLAQLQQLQQENIYLKQEKEQLEEEIMTYRHDSKHPVANSKEVKILKKVIKSLEEEVLKEHMKYQKSITKKNDEIMVLQEEVESLRLSERLLQTKLKCLTNELTTIKLGYKRSTSGSSEFGRRGSRDLAVNPRSKKSQHVTKSSKKNRLRTLSPSPSFPRFDPTAYIEQKKKRHSQSTRKANALFKPRSLSGSIEKLHHKSFCFSPKISPSNHFLGQKNSSIASSDSYQYSVKSDVNSGARNSKKKSKNSTDHKSEISDIDARLHALQDFMKRSLDSAKSYSRP